MLVIKVIGKQAFVSHKKNQEYFILHTIFQKDDVQGYACEGRFVSPDLFNKTEINKFYAVIYDAYSNGRAYISDLREVENNN